MRIVQKIRRLAEAEVQDSGYSTAQLAVLFQVLFTDGITQQELASELEVTKGNVAQLVEKLEQSGFLVREREGHANRLHLTEQGVSYAKQQLELQEQFIEQRMAALTVEEQAQLLTLLRKLDHQLR